MSISPLTPSNDAIILELPSSKARMLFDSSISILLLFDFNDISTSEKYLAATSVDQKSITLFVSRSSVIS